MNRFFVGLVFAFGVSVFGQEFESKPSDPYFEKFPAKAAPATKGLLLQKGDRLAICGDSITEQKMYSRVIETYLAVAVPELDVRVRQYGWGGETAPGFLARMTNDCLRFKPTIATTCYGMNDHGYRPYEEVIGKRYRDNSAAIVRAFKGAGARVIQGSPGCVGKGSDPKREAMNQNLCELRNIGIDIAREENAGFADVFWPMLTQEFLARQKYGDNYLVAGKDGVHPGWSGHFIMAYAFLKAMGLDGNIGTLTIDLASNTATGSAGHDLVGFKENKVEFKSSRYPFCASGDVTKDDNIRSAMSLIPFNQELNRLMLVVKNAKASSYKVTWGDVSRSYSAEELGKGVNLAADFEKNPFTEAFNKVDAAVAAKQNYETRQIKDLFHGPEGREDLEATAALTEKVRGPMARKVVEAVVPVTHSITLVAE